ncbi:Hypothetical predicted protein [Mytilus galloprovincialis]|uniref:Uncharacterized protein n=1 Tax=Mytilus galloprovincialis TaxID=29158 RepID=A0A8B6C7N1_MYTGA|nr:Hypothetical predicted protein [Mytilus galloprovincialis]
MGGTSHVDLKDISSGHLKTLKTIAFKILLRTFVVPSLFEIQQRMLVLGCLQELLRMDGGVPIRWRGNKTNPKNWEGLGYKGEKLHHKKENPHHNKEKPHHNREKHYYNREKAHHDREKGHHNREKPHHNNENPHHNRELPRHNKRKTTP